MGCEEFILHTIPHPCLSLSHMVFRGSFHRMSFAAVSVSLIHVVVYFYLEESIKHVLFQHRRRGDISQLGKEQAQARVIAARAYQSS